MKSQFRGMTREQLKQWVSDASDALAEVSKIETNNWSMEVEKASPGASIGYAASGRDMTDAEKLEWLFKYHSDVKKDPIYDAINLATRRCAEDILKHVPACADRTHALRLIRDVRMWANAAVACDGISF